ncbi:decaprenyl-phosphate phosphoribosyltransferase [bacterium]|nr:decaprenyl-phosphate phosphoribosyltransferase [bacterium]
MKLSSLIRLIKPQQWIKNSFVFAPLLFSGLFINTLSVKYSIFTFLIFCIASSAVYVFNDYFDIESDKKHPVKSLTRPLATGEITKPQGLIVIIILYALTIIAIFVHPKIGFVISSYILLNVMYTLYFKHQPVLDIFSIATGFVLRVYAGAVALEIPLSSWMFITTMSLALFLISIKRRQELINNGSSSRKVLKLYSIKLIDKFADLAAISSILFYSLFIMSDKPNMVFTIPFVVFGFYRYWFIVDAKNLGESPTEAIFSDWLLKFNLLGWLLACLSSFL